MGGGVRESEGNRGSEVKPDHWRKHKGYQGFPKLGWGEFGEIRSTFRGCNSKLWWQSGAGSNSVLSCGRRAMSRTMIKIAPPRGPSHGRTSRKGAASRRYLGRAYRK